VSRRTEPPVDRTAKAPAAAGDVTKTAVDRPRSATSRTAKSRAAHAAYQVQLAVHPTEKRAQRGWREIRHSASDILGNLGHAIKQTDVRKSSTRLYRLRTLAFADRAPAQALCAKLKRRDIECIVVSSPTRRPGLRAKRVRESQRAATTAAPAQSFGEARKHPASCRRRVAEKLHRILRLALGPIAPSVVLRKPESAEGILPRVVDISRHNLRTGSAMTANRRSIRPRKSWVNFITWHGASSTDFCSPLN
jgi:hypothetical protein